MSMNNVFLILAIKPLNDGTKGFRFNFFGKKGGLRLRKYRRSPLHFNLNKRLGEGGCFTIRTFGRFYLWTLRKNSARKLHHFAG